MKIEFTQSEQDVINYLRFLEEREELKGMGANVDMMHAILLDKYKRAACLMELLNRLDWKLTLN